ncbi:HmuY family protein [Parachryseolinea silvisoli]|uniref:HmuY family protein n=1 Tax=Parachryseolinea silvisoli TaxID=2873601 RepID=UPI002265F203|nr:HmuY family protein [Parachryseolinea silvisoli]MCD9013912.1 HmuY family protein [Parachryseolinea silvisoli]
MNSLNRFLKLAAIACSIIFLALVINACSDDDPPLPANEADFEATALGLEEGQEEAEIKLTLSRAADVATDFTVSFVATGVQYGTHFTTDPAATDGKLTVSIPAASSTVSFKVLRKSNVFLDGDASIIFTVGTAAQNAVIGEKSTVTVSFSPIVSEGQQMKLEGIISDELGSSAGNSVFVDFSSNQQTGVARASWDLGFYSGDEFRVIINNTTAASVIAVEATDLADVTAENVETEGLALGQGAGTFDIIDDVTGDLTKTAIEEISATEADNKVYIINRTGGFGIVDKPENLIKLRVVRNGAGYKLQYAALTSTDFKEVQVTKSATNDFTYVSFTTGAMVEVAPAREKWDIEWTYSIYKAPQGIPYAYSDLVFINSRGGVSAVQVLETTVSYDQFAASNVASLKFDGQRDVIGSSWRVTSVPPGSTDVVGVRTDRYYVVKDAYENVYKLRFINFHSADGGTRGKPLIEYKLVVKG